MSASRRPRTVTPNQLRAAMLGRPVDGVEVVRQAWRVRGDDSDELVLISARGRWWVARRTADQITLWAFVGDTEAEAAFERLVVSGTPDDVAWHLATAS
jgi:cyanophycinase-like exopeptidase